MSNDTFLGVKKLDCKAIGEENGVTSESALNDLLAELPMTKDGAIEAMKAGKKVTHRHFDPDEWMVDKDGLFEFEDGCRCEYQLFWGDRTDDSWLEGWKEYS